jgi:hypothetical protein
MWKREDKQRSSAAGFSAIEAIVIVVVIAAAGLGGWYVYHREHKAKSSNVSTSSGSQGSKKTITPPPADPYAGWKMYVDAGYASSTGISIKYPPTWKISVDGGPTVGNSTDPVAEINLRSVELATPQTAEQEWTTCASTISADACGAAPSDKVISGNSATVNGLDTYSATMESDIGTYYVTVVKGDRSTPPAGTPFDEFTVSSTNPSVLATFRKIMSTATFSN